MHLMTFDIPNALGWDLYQGAPDERVRNYNTAVYESLKYRFMGLAMNRQPLGPYSWNQLRVVFPLWLPTLESALALLWTVLRKRRKDAIVKSGFMVENPHALKPHP